MLKVIGILLIVLFAHGCSQESEGESSLFSPDNSNSSQSENSTSESGNSSEEEVVASTLYISVYSDKLNIPLGEAATLTAIAFKSDGTAENVSNTATWSASDDSLISFSTNIATALASGDVSVTASFDNKSASTTLRPFNATPTSLVISSNDLTLSSDGSAKLTANVFFDNGISQDISSDAIWSSNNTAVVEVNSEGLVSAVGTGSTSIDVDYGGFIESVSVTITSAVVSSLEVSPVIGAGAKGQSQQFYATAVMDDNSNQDLTEIASWSSSDSSIIEIDNNGLALLKSAGTVTVTADYGVFSDTVTFTVTDITLSSLTVTLSEANPATDITVYANCLATYEDGSLVDVTESVTWSVADNSIATVSNSAGDKGQITTLSSGTTNITANLSGTSASETITVTSAILTTIEVTPGETFISSGVDAQFRAIGTYDDGEEVDITSDVTWSTDDSSLGTISNLTASKGYLTNFYEGVSTENLVVTASLGAVSDTASVIIAPGTITSISVNPTEVNINSLSTQQIKAYAHFSDGASVEITDVATWSTNNDSIAIVSNALSNPGEISSIAEGSAIITATYGGLSSANSVITVSDSDPESTNEVGTGLLATYYSGNNFDTLAGQRIDSQLNFNWDTGQAPLGVGDYFSVRWTGQIEGKITGDCTIASRSDDGFRVYIDGNLIIDVWFAHAPRWDYAYNVPFEEGVKQDITVEFFENGGHAVAELYWECEGDSVQESIPTQYLYSN